MTVETKQNMTNSPLPTIAEAEAIDREQWLHMYEQMVKIRIFEEHANSALSPQNARTDSYILERKQWQ